MRDLARRGARRVLCEGGPTLNAALFEAGLVDELFLTIAPKLIGGDDPLTIVKGGRFGVIGLELRSLVERDGELFLQVRRVTSSRWIPVRFSLGIAYDPSDGRGSVAAAICSMLRRLTRARMKRGRSAMASADGVGSTASPGRVRSAFKSGTPARVHHNPFDDVLEQIDRAAAVLHPDPDALEPLRHARRQVIVSAARHDGRRAPASVRRLSRHVRQLARPGQRRHSLSPRASTSTTAKPSRRGWPGSAPSSTFRSAAPRAASPATR